MPARWMQTRQTKYTAYASAYIVVILAVLATVNFLANRYDKTYDSTKNKQFSLSDQTIKVVKGLKSDVHITYFDQQERFVTARDTLDRYANLSSKVKVEYIDPNRKPQQARAAGYTRDTPILVDTGIRKEPAKSLTEEEITGALIRAQKTQTRNVCFLSAGGEHSIDQQDPGGFSTAKALLEKDNYKTRAITPKTAGAADATKQVTIGQKQEPVSVEIPKDCSVLVIAGPQAAYSQTIVDAIKAYETGGGRTLFMLDNSLRIGREAAPNDSPELLKLLADWGVTVNKDLVLDLSGVGRLFGLGPEIPVLLQYESHVITRPLNRIPTAFPLARSLDIKSGGGATVEKLLSTSEDSVAVTNVGAGGAIDVKNGKKGPLTLAAAGTLSEGNNKNRFIVIGTAQFALNNLLGSRAVGNGDLFLNMVNWLSSDEDLISIRPKEPENQTLNMSGQRGPLMFWMSVVLFPLAVVGMGLGTWWKRR